MGFNERLKQIRKEKGLTQAEVAAYVGLKSSTTYSSDVLKQDPYNPEYRQYT